MTHPKPREWVVDQPDSERLRRIQELFHHSRSLQESDRASYLDVQCDGDKDLRHVLENLLAAADPSGPGSTQESLELVSGCFTVATAASRGSPKIGRYRAVRLVGSGALSDVYESVDDCGSTVACKVFRRSGSTARLLRTFSMERSALQQLRHTGIARLLDSGITESGHYYLVLEFVDGVPLDQYCATNGLNLEHRLRLVERICRIVHHAHQNLVLHCDLKPGNILVPPDGEPKIVDFGLARILDPELARERRQSITEKDRGFTLAYASPEQIRCDWLTTASDIYSLGAVLYTIVTGKPPLPVEGASVLELGRLVLESDPVPPSRANPGFAKAASRPACPRDVDHIVMMALRKDPAQRYGAADQMADDIARFLRGLPVHAQPYSKSERLRRFVVRNKTLIALTSIIALTLLTGLAGTFVGLRRAVVERQAATQNAEELASVVAFIQRTFYPPNTSLNRQDATLIEVLEDAKRQLNLDARISPAVRSTIQLHLSGAFANIGQYDRAGELLDASISLREARFGPDSSRVAEIRHARAALFHVQGRPKEAVQHAEEASRVYRRLGKRDLLIENLINLGSYQMLAGTPRQAMKSFAEAEVLLGAGGAGDLEPALYAELFSNQGTALVAAGRLEDGRRKLERAFELFREQTTRNDAPGSIVLNNLAKVHAIKANYLEALGLLTQALQEQRAKLGPSHRHTAETLNNLGCVHYMRGDYGAAIAWFTEAATIRRQLFAADHPLLVDTLRNLARTHLKLGQNAAAGALYAEVVESCRNSRPEGECQHLIAEAAGGPVRGGID